jgi:hypothetical protein
VVQPSSCSKVVVIDTLFLVLLEPKDLLGSPSSYALMHVHLHWHLLTSICLYHYLTFSCTTTRGQQQLHYSESFPPSHCPIPWMRSRQDKAKPTMWYDLTDTQTHTPSHDFYSPWHEFLLFGCKRRAIWRRLVGWRNGGTKYSFCCFPIRLYCVHTLEYTKEIWLATWEQ